VAAAVPVAERLPLPLLHGRTLLALGRIERRGRRRAAARDTLTAARDRFRSIGAAAWTASAERELGRIGGRTSSGRELTPTEDSVARLVATGMSNREVAAALFVTPKAIEASLARIYAKRGVRSRTELAHLLAEEASGKQ
jgi:DNA-binding NarL/FixJ family response regulator